MMQPTNLMHGMYESCADVLSLGARLANAPSLPEPDELRMRIGALLDQMGSKGEQMGLSQDDIQDARYALVAYLDEQIQQSNWAGRQEWLLQPLQMQYFDEATAGEGFFVRLKALESRPERVHVLQVYFLCLSLGFQGMYAVRGPGALGALMESLGARLGRALPGADSISPHGVPPDTGRGRRGKQTPVVALSIAMLALAITLFVGFKIVIVSTVSDAVTSLHQSTAQILGHPKAGR